MKACKTEVLGLIPARGGSKSIHKKNIVPLNGQPLIAYVLNAGKRSECLGRIICSTDDNSIAEVCSRLGAEVVERPKELAQDDTHVMDVMIHVLESLKEKDGYQPWAVALLQPTSPFLLPEHIHRCVMLLRDNPGAGSSQTIAEFPHNYHAYNQRVVEDGIVRFRFAEERALCYNKQKKPKLHIFGNLVVTRTEALLREREIFAPPSLAHAIDFPYALDIDRPEDLDLAEWYIHKGKVSLPEMGG
jgi:CMP-N,N'-diacetyllegionaminic acid synthase